MLAFASLICGLIFGFGLMLSGMTQPAKVLGFLDVFGLWDPTLGFVMAGALAVTGVGYRLLRWSGRPLLAARLEWPTRTDIDRPLVAGSILFGIGWGLAGLCPGPALVNLASLSPGVIVFVVAMVAGMGLKDVWERASRATVTPSASAASQADG